MTLRSMVSDLYLSGGTANTPGPVIIANGTFTTSSTTVPADTGRGEATDWFTGSVLVPIAGAVAFQPRRIVNFAVTTGVFTLDEALPFTAVPGLVRYVIIAGAYDVVPAVDNTDNGTPAHVIGQKGDAAAAGAVTVTDTLVGQMKQLINTLETTVGIPVWLAAADPGNNVSISEAIRRIFDQQLGTGTDAGQNSILGTRVVKANGDPTAAAGSPDALFDVTGQVLVTLIYGEVTTIISGGTAPEISLQTISDNLTIAASTVITTDAAGTLYMVSGDPADLLLGGGGSDIPQIVFGSYGAAAHNTPFIIDGDGIEQLNGGGAVATGGVISWTLFFIPLEDSATVVASA